MSGKKCIAGCQCRRHNNPAVGRPRNDEDPHIVTRHDHVRLERGRADDHKCIACDNKARDWAQIHGSDGKNPDQYVPLCRGCHVCYDRYPNFQLEDIFNKEIREISLSIVAKHIRYGKEVKPV